MTKHELPEHPTLTHPRTGEPIRAVFVSPRTGRIYWPVLGASEPPPGGDPGPGANPPAPTWPANTPVEQMTSEQQAAYWKHQSQRHEGRATANFGLLKHLGVNTQAEAQALLDKAKHADEVDAQNSTEAEKREKQARETARAEADAHYRPQLARAAFRNAAVGRIGADKVDGILAPFGDMSYFLDDKGDVDTAKVTGYIDSIAPAKGTPRPAGGKPNAPFIPGHNPGGQPPAAPGAQGRAMAEKRFGKKQ